MKGSFKDREKLIRRFASDYQKSKLIELKGLDLLNNGKICDSVAGYMDSKDKYKYYYNLQVKIDYILERIEWEYSNFLKREFFNCVTKSEWWECYYSRSTYYRKKSKAMNLFLGLIYV